MRRRMRYTGVVPRGACTSTTESWESFPTSSKHDWTRCASVTHSQIASCWRRETASTRHLTGSKQPRTSSRTTDHTGPYGALFYCPCHAQAYGVYYSHARRRAPTSTSKHVTNNNDLLPLIQQAYDAFSVGDTVKASAFRAKLNIRLKQRGQSPAQFWADFQKAAELIAAK